MSTSSFDALIHAPNRLQICALLSSTASIEFKTVRDELDVSDSVLSKHIKLLENANYVILDKRLHAGRPRTWLSLSPEGLNAFNRHVNALREIVG